MPTLRINDQLNNTFAISLLRREDGDDPTPCRNFSNMCLLCASIAKDSFTGRNYTFTYHLNNTSHCLYRPAPLSKNKRTELNANSGQGSFCCPHANPFLKEAARRGYPVIIIVTARCNDYKSLVSVSSFSPLFRQCFCLPLLFSLPRIYARARDS
jgi:hypothetical protein